MANFVSDANRRCGECSRVEVVGSCHVCARAILHPDCPECRKRDPGSPWHDGMPQCKSGSLASGGANTHCTCDTCF